MLKESLLILEIPSNISVRRVLGKEFAYLYQNVQQAQMGEIIRCPNTFDHIPHIPILPLIGTGLNRKTFLSQPEGTDFVMQQNFSVMQKEKFLI